MRDLVTDDVLKFGHKFRFDKHITREEETLSADSFSIADLIDFLSWNKHLVDEILKAEALDFLFEILFCLLLLTACGSEHIPLLGIFTHD